MSPDPLWYKDAIIYQTHVKSFHDSNNDGVGDFVGLTSKLDYLKELGITAIWLLPFYPSPGRDDGYDIADYRGINPQFGSMVDFRQFVRAAHARDIRVITELVINHTSDQHPWFQRSRTAPRGSSARNFYVWSDTDKKWPETRIIFSDTEPSNWTWDPVAKQFYWHRFFSHQPDLNFDSPRVLSSVLNVMRFWLDMGVDGLRLDAVPYLVERDSTINENLPETHDIIRKIRAALDARYADRMLLGEANQWPEDVRAYFGDGDECHMAFHFPLMPRIYMAVAQEDRHPIVDIMRQTPDIPSNCQWATFLRNHDELTLEMVSDRERDYLWNFYAADPRARINFGIRRRLAPLMGNDRRKIELLVGLLFSMPGTPVLYYGDEIGMGDNIFLGDRNGVRTPMHWSPDRNGGFSVADPAHLYLPTIMDPIYGYQAINVEAQRRSASSLLNWMRQVITVAKPQRAFGRGDLQFLTPKNRKILAYLRAYEDETVLCVANMSRAPQAVELPLQPWKGRVPIELLGHSAFPPIGDLPYLLTLDGYGFFWFRLAEDPGAEEAVVLSPELPTLVIPRGWSSLIEGTARSTLERSILPAFLPQQRWFQGKGKAIDQAMIKGAVPLGDTHSGALLALVSADDGRPYVMPLGIAWETGTLDPVMTLGSLALARVRQGAKVGVLYDASAAETLARAVIDGLAGGTVLESGSLALRFEPIQPPPEIPEIAVKRLGGDQSNSAMAVGDQLVVKLLRRPEPGPNPEVEITRYLASSPLPVAAPKLFGTVDLADAAGEVTTVALVQQFVANQGDGWQLTLDYLHRVIADARVEAAPGSPAAEEPNGYFAELARRLGTRTGELHAALAAGNGDFAAEPVSAADRAAWLAGFDATIARAFAILEALPEPSPAVAALKARRTEVRPGLPRRLVRPKTRIHGDFHLGQVLVTKNDFMIIDFEGEPARPLDDRRQKQSPLRDVAGMLRSFDYAMAVAINRGQEAFGEDPARLEGLLLPWLTHASSAFLEGYQEAGEALDEEAHALIRCFAVEKACYEIAYEAGSRPAWIDVPVRGLLRMIGGAP